MHVTTSPLDLFLRTTFTLATSSSDVRHNVLVRIDEGLGEAPVVPHYHETTQGVMDYIAQVALKLGDDPFQLEDILARLPRAGASAAGYAAIDVALHDLIGNLYSFVSAHMHAGSEDGAATCEVCKTARKGFDEHRKGCPDCHE